jgi:MFS family permease
MGNLTADGWILFATRGLRMFAYGFLSVVLVLYLSAEGIGKEWIGVLLTAALLGDVVFSLLLTTSADRLGRRRMLIVGALLMVFAGIVFTVTSDFTFLLIAATVGVLSPSDKEVGPFLSIEQATLAEELPAAERTKVFAWYNLTGSLTAALGSLAGGIVAQQRMELGYAGPEAYRPIVAGYAIVGVVLVGGFLLLGPRSEARGEKKDSPGWFDLGSSQSVIFRLSALFALDAFGGGFILQSLLVDWFHQRYGFEPAVLGSVFFMANLLAAASALAAAGIAEQIGLVQTMVFTHLPSNLLLILVPFMPDGNWAIGVFLLRCSISQMDVPTRQSFTMAVVEPHQRSAAAGITTVARSVGGALAPLLAGALFAHADWRDVPLYLAGGVKIVYDLWLYREFVGEQAEHPTA